MSTAPREHLFHPDNMARYTSTMVNGLRMLLEHMSIQDRPVTGLSPELAAKPVLDVDLDRPLVDMTAALEEVRGLWLQDTVHFHDPKYAAHLNCPVVIPALVAELFMAAINTSMDTFDQSVGATYMERHLLDWVADRAGYPQQSRDGIFTSGGSQSNLQALLLAVGEAREAGAQTHQLRIFTSADSHFSIAKSARMLGLADDAVVAVPTDHERRMDVTALHRLMAASEAKGRVTTAVIATAGTTDFGIIDPLLAIAEACRDHETWFHVDAAYGGGLLVSPKYADLLTGIQHSDSVTIDFHKSWFQPVSSSALLVRDGATMRHASWHADYLNPKTSGNPNQVDKSLQTTRRFDAVKLWLTLRVMGPDGIGECFDHAIDLARTIHTDLSAMDDIELVTASDLSTIVFRFVVPGLDEAHLAETNRRIRAALWASGRAVVAGTTVDGRAFLKLTLLNPKATPADIHEIIDQVRSVGHDTLVVSA